MTKQEALSILVSMKPGTKVTHRYFSDGEFIYRDENGKLRDEEGCFLIENEFWISRSGAPWEDGWSIKK